VISALASLENKAKSSFCIEKQLQLFEQLFEATATV